MKRGLGMAGSGGAAGSGSGTGVVRGSSGVGRSSSGSKLVPAPPEGEEARRALLSHLQTAFQRLDKAGSGAAPTGALVRSLRMLLASQTKSPRASRGWAAGLSQICTMLDGRLEESQVGGEAGAIEKLAMGWEELLALANEVHA